MCLKNMETIVAWFEGEVLKRSLSHPSSIITIFVQWKIYLFLFFSPHYNEKEKETCSSYLTRTTRANFILLLFIVKRPK